MQHLTERDCEGILEACRQQVGFACPYCSGILIKKTTEKLRYRCCDCYSSFSLIQKTVMHKSHLDLKKWFELFYYIHNSRSGFSVREISEKIGVNKNTASRMMQCVRKYSKDPKQRKLIVLIVEKCMMNGEKYE